MKSTPALLLLSLPAAAGLSAGQTSNPPPAAVQAAHQLTPGDILAAQVAEIAQTKDLSQRAKNRQIGSAVRLAVVTTTTHLKSRDDAEQMLLEMARQAAAAAPDFADAITEASLGAAHQVPLLADAAGLKDAVQQAVFAGVKAAAVSGGEAHFDTSEGKSSAPSSPATPEFGGKTDAVIVSPSH